jgi:hypothetical protein
MILFRLQQGVDAIKETEVSVFISEGIPHDLLLGVIDGMMQ